MRCDLGEIENETRAKAKKGCEALLAAIVLHHGKIVPHHGECEPPPVELEPPPIKLVEPLPPIPNTEIAAASAMAFPLFSDGKMRVIMRATAQEYAPVTVMDIVSQRRTKAVVQARQVVMYLAKTMTTRSLPEVGRRIGGRDHTTVLHGVRKIECRLKTDPGLVEQVNRIRQTIDNTSQETRYLAFG